MSGGVREDSGPERVTGDPAERNSEEHFSGCLFGGAVGDALGAPLEFMSLDQIRATFGSEGLTDFVEAYGKRGAITDDTQMTMFTAEGLLRGYCRWSHRGIASAAGMAHHAYLRWLKTQGQMSSHPAFAHATRANENGWLLGVQALHACRAPGNTCLSALRSSRMGTMEEPLNDSKGCGGVMRMAPVGLFFGDANQAFETGCEFAAITHGHPSGYLAAGCFAAIISQLVAGADLAKAVECALDILKGKPRHEECADAVARAVEMASKGNPSPEAVESLGAGWVAEEALAISLYCALVESDDFSRGLLLAVNHGGDSDSTGAITGNILGLLHGERAIPQRWLRRLELCEEIRELASDMITKFRDDDAWWQRYPGG